MVALANDVQAVVLRDGAGRLTRYGKGDWLPGKTWKVSRVDADRVVLRAAESLGGQAVTARLAAGERFDPQSLAASKAQMQATPSIPLLRSTSVPAPRPHR